MSRRLHLQKHLGLLREIGAIMNAMKNISLIETHKLARFVTCQHRVLASIEATAEDFLAHHSGVGFSLPAARPGIIIAIGSQRGFCGDFNETLAQAVRRQRKTAERKDSRVVIVGRRLATKLNREPGIAAAFDGPTVAEEVQPVLTRVMETLSNLQAQADSACAIWVLAHREGETEVSDRYILPAPPGNPPNLRFPYPPLLNVAPRQFFAHLARHYLWAQMHDVFYGSLMAENRRRLQHLEGAMQLMEEKSDDLQRRCNLMRQEEITEEIEVIMLSNDSAKRSF